MPHSGERTQTRNDTRRDRKKQARSASPDRSSSNRYDRQELEERSTTQSDSSVPDVPKREPRERAQARVADQARGLDEARQSPHSEEERKFGQKPEQANEEVDED